MDTDDWVVLLTPKFANRRSQNGLCRVKRTQSDWVPTGFEEFKITISGRLSCYSSSWDYAEMERKEVRGQSGIV